MRRDRSFPPPPPPLRSRRRNSRVMWIERRSLAGGVLSATYAYEMQDQVAIACSD